MAKTKHELKTLQALAPEMYELLERMDVAGYQAGSSFLPNVRELIDKVGRAKLSAIQADLKQREEQLAKDISRDKADALERVLAEQQAKMKKVKTVSREMEMDVEQLLSPVYVMQFVRDVELYSLSEAVALAVQCLPRDKGEALGKLAYEKWVPCGH